MNPDRYWIVRGLLVSGMYRSACGVVLNLLAAAEAFGFVPNGLRAYYLTRSQPPLLSQMVHVLLDSFDEAAAAEEAAAAKAAAAEEEKKEEEQEEPNSLSVFLLHVWACARA
jgi:neutral trehalase